MAADSSTVVARIGLDDNGFQSAISRIQRSLRVIQSDFSSASSGLGEFGNSTERLRLRADSLNRQIGVQRDLVTELRTRYEQAVQAYGENSRAAENLRIRLNNANTSLNNMQRELDETNRQLSIQTSRWNTLSQTLSNAGDRMKTVGEKMSAVGTKLSTAVTLPILGIGTAATKMAMDAVESENLFEVAMGNMAKDARKWSEETSKALGLNAFNVRKNVATYNAMLTSMGLTGDESLKMSQGLTQLSYDMASFYNLKPEEAFEKLKSGISGEAEPLKALGILVNDNTIKTYAYANGIAKQGEALTEAQKVQARYGAIMQATKNAQGDLARTMDSPTNKLRIMKEQAEQIGIQFGQILIPILERLMAVIKPLMDRFQGLSKEQQETIVKIALVAAAIGPVILIIGKVIGVIGTLSTVIGSISGAIATAGGLSAALGSAFAVITGPVGITIAAIAGLIAIFVALYKNNEEFRNNVNTIWSQIKTTISSAIEGLKVIIQTFVTIAKELWSKYGDDIINILSKAFNFVAAIVNTQLNIIKNIIKIVTSLIKGDWHGVWDGIKSLTIDFFNGIKNIIGTAVELLVSIFKFQFEVIKSVVLAVWEGIKAVTLLVWNSMKDALSPIVQGIASFISSVWEGIKAGTAFAWEVIKAIFTTVWTVISTIVQTYVNIVTAIISVAWGLIKVITEPIWNAISGFISSVWNGIVTFLNPIIQSIVSFITTAWNTIQNVTITIFDAVSGFINTVWNGVLSFLTPIINSVVSIVTKAWNSVKSVTTTIWDGIKSLLSTVWNAIKNTTSTVWNSISGFFTTLWNNISGLFGRSVGGIKTSVSNVWSGILDVTNSVWDKIKSAITTPINAAANFVKEQIDKIKNFFASMNISFPKIKLPHFKINGEFSLKPPSVPTLGVDWYATGGIFNRPSIIGVGEAGTEAVLPIDRLDDLMASAIEKAKAKAKANGSNGSGITLNIENFINNTEKDIERIAYELEFYRQRVAMGRGGI